MVLLWNFEVEHFQVYGHIESIPEFLFLSIETGGSLSFYVQLFCEKSVLLSLVSAMYPDACSII